MQRCYQNDGVNSFVSIEEKNIPVDSYEYDMIKNNDIKCLLPFEFRSLNGENIIYYKINNCVSLKSFVEAGKLDYSKISLLYKNLLALIEEIPAYLLKVNSLVLDQEGIYFNGQKRRFMVMYFSEYKKDFRLQIKTMTEGLLKKVDHRDRNLVDLIYDIYEIVCDTNFDINRLKKLIYQKKKEDGRIDKAKAWSENNTTSPKREEAFKKDNFQEGKIGNKDKLLARDKLLDQFFSVGEENIKTSEKTTNASLPLYKIILIISIILTGLIGMVLALIQFGQSGHIEYVKPLMGVLILMAIECFIYIQLKNKEAQDENNAEKQYKKEIVGDLQSVKKSVAIEKTHRADKPEGVKKPQATKKSGDTEKSQEVEERTKKPQEVEERTEIYLQYPETTLLAQQKYTLKSCGEDKNKDIFIDSNGVLVGRQKDQPKVFTP